MILDKRPGATRAVVSAGLLERQVL
jgi:hypothetical protein